VSVNHDLPGHPLRHAGDRGRKPPPGNGSRPDVTWTRWVLALVAVLAPSACGLRAAESRRRRGCARERGRRPRSSPLAGVAVGRACEACRGRERHHGLDVIRGDRSCCPDRRGVRASDLRGGRAHSRRADAARVGGAARLSGRASADADRALRGLCRPAGGRAHGDRLPAAGRTPPSGASWRPSRSRWRAASCASVPCIRRW
jgi:hypothetical protein